MLLKSSVKTVGTHLLREVVLICPGIGFVISAKRQASPKIGEQQVELQVLNLFSDASHPDFLSVPCMDILIIAQNIPKETSLFNYNAKGRKLRNKISNLIQYAGAPF